MERTNSSEEVLVCQRCGDKGFTNAFIYCVKCVGFVIHRYCLDVIPRTSYEYVPWFCEDCKSPVPSQFTLPKLEPSQSQKEGAASSAHVKRTRHTKKLRKNISSLVAGKDDVSCRKEATEPDRDCVSPTNSPLEAASAHVKRTRLTKKQKKKIRKKISSLVAGQDDVSCREEATEPDRECVSPTNSPLEAASVRSDSGHNEINPCVVSRTGEGVCRKQASKFAQLDDNSSPLKRSAKRKRNATSLAAKTNEHRTRKACTKTVDSIEHSWCGSSCTTVTSKNNEGMAQSVEEQRCEIPQSVVTTNQMHSEQDMSASKAGADASQSADFENTVHYIHYRSASPVLDPVWRGSFNIIQTDYDLLEGFVGHLSTKACYKVCEEATMLPPLLCLEMHPKTALWPKSFLESEPSDENIALYIFPGDTKNERAYDHLVIDMMDEGLAMKATTKNAELLIFTSTVLPRSYWRFQAKYYLWGVFRSQRKDSSTPVNHDLAVSNNSNNHCLSEIPPDEVTSGKKSSQG